jgi:hypothetical protein
MGVFSSVINIFIINQYLITLSLHYLSHNTFYPDDNPIENSDGDSSKAFLSNLSYCGNWKSHIT